MDTVGQIFQKAIEAINSGKPIEAEQCFKNVLKRQPNHVAALNLLTVVLMSIERHAEAEAFISRAINLNQSSDVSYYNYGLISKKLGKFQQAVEQFNKAIYLNAQVPETWNNRGTVFNDLQQYEKAIVDFDQAISLNSNYSDALCNKGKSLSFLKRFDEALAAYDKALSIKADLAEAWLGRGNVFRALKHFDQTLAAYDKGLAINPDLAEAWLVRGEVFSDLMRFDEALAAYDKALSIKADLAGAWLGRGNVFTDVKRYDEAFAAYDKAIALKPDMAEAWLGRGNLFITLKQYDDAFTAYDTALTLNPDLGQAWLGRGNVFFCLNRDEEALECFEKAIILGQDAAEAYWNKSLLKLSLGEYDEGWRLYEWRWKSKSFTSPVRNFSQPLWLGNDSVAGKTILVHSEQGFGDTIQFCRYLEKLEALGCEIIFETQPQMVPLVKAQANKYRILGQGETLPNFDVHCPLLSLPLAFKTTLETIPASIPYLIPSAEKVESWKTRLGKKDKARIGVAWSGRVFPDFRRSIPLEVLSKIITKKNEKVEWHSLQKDVRESDRNSLESTVAITNHTPYLNDFSDTASLIAELDLVISIDTAAAHLAGALGKPVWILLPFHPDFRWLRDREDNPWYPTARLFRQARDGEWSDVLEKVSNDLGRWIIKG